MTRPHIRLVEPPVDYDTRPAINDNGPIPPGIAILETWGGYFGLAVCIVAAVFMGVCLAVQL